MHISDGILPNSFCIAGYLITAAVLAPLIRKVKPANLPRISVVTAIFFVASLINIPIGITSVHLVLNGLVGIILGWDAFISIFLGITLQALLFQHGGLTTIGVNTAMMGLAAMISASVFQMRKLFPAKNPALLVTIFAAIAGMLAIIISTAILALLLIKSGDNFAVTAQYIIIAQLPVLIVEGIICGFTASFLYAVKPELIDRFS